jgi:hypothetical protein
MWWYMPIIPALGRLRQEDPELEASLGFIMETKVRTKIKVK